MRGRHQHQAPRPLRRVADVKQQLRSLAHRVFVSAGITRVGRRLRDPNGTLILYGHRVSDDDESFFQGLAPDWLREQLGYLTRNYEVIPLSTLLGCIEEQRPVPPRSVVLTFDDGFRDFVENAVPILDEFGVTATVYVVTESLSDGRLPWSQRLGYMFQKTTATELQHVMLGREPVALTGEAQRRRVYAQMMRLLESVPREPRDGTIEELARLLEIDPPRDRMMTWQHAREVIDGGHEVGAHTYSHALLARVPASEARLELERCKADLEEHLGLRHSSFCFPAASTTAELRSTVRDLGFRSCFVSNRSKRLNRLGDVDAFSLVRVGQPNGRAVNLEAELDGPSHGIRRLVGRYAQVGGR